MQITSQHAEAIGQRTRVGVKERLLLDGIALHSTDVSPRNVQFPALIEPNLTDAGLSFSYRAAMPAGDAADAVPLNRLVEFAFSDILVEYFAEGGQRKTSASILFRAE